MSAEDIKKFVNELSITRIAFAQSLIDRERKDNYVPLTTVVKSWVFIAPEMQRDEWLSGARALLHYLQVSDSRSSDEAIVLLQKAEQQYDFRYELFRRIHPRRGKKPAEAYQMARENLLLEMLPENHDSDQIPRCDNGDIPINSDLNYSWKLAYTKGLAWLKILAKASVIR